MLNSQSIEQPTGTVTLGWAPVRSVPEPFVGLVKKAEAEAVLWHSQPDAESLQAWVESWEQVLRHDEYEAAPLTFRLDALNRLGNAYLTRGFTQKQENDLRGAEACFQQGLDLTALQSPDRAKFLFNLGHMRVLDYRQTNAFSDLKYSIDMMVQAIAVASPVDPYLRIYHDSLGLALIDRYDREGNLADLEEAILHGEEVLRSTEPNTEAWARYHSHLGVRYYRRYLRNESMPDLDHAIELGELSLKYATDQRSRPYRLTNLGNSLLKRYEVLRQPEDLNRALDSHQTSVDLTPENDRSLAVRLNNLGNSLRSKYHTTQNVPDISWAIEVYRKAVKHTLQTEPLLVSRLYNLANSFRERYIQTQTREDLKWARDNYRKVCNLGIGYSLEWMLEAARIWGAWAMERHAWKEAEEAFNYGLQAIDQLYERQLIGSHRESWLRQARDLAELAAYALARRKNSTLAIAVLEQNRTRALNDALDYQDIAIGSLSPADKKDLALVRKRIQQLEMEAYGEEDLQKRDFRSISKDLRQAQSELTMILDRIRLYAPGFQEQGLDTVEILSLVETLQKPLVYLLTTMSGSLALVVTPIRKPTDERKKRIHIIWLDHFASRHLNYILFDSDNSQHYLHQIVLGYTDALKNVLQELWPILQSLMAPIVGKLLNMGYRQAVLVPTGLLSLLPLHAVDPDQMSISFVPSARALKSVLLDEDHIDIPASLLGVANPSSFRKLPLRYANFEVKEIEALFGAKGLQGKSLAEGLAQRERIVQNASGNTYLHFACHGQFDVFHPMDSRIYLSGQDTLTLRNIMEGEINISSARLITLSACQTGIVDFRNVPDEAVGFPGGLIQAGVPGIISTLWPVDDMSTACLMIQFYRNHLERHMEPSQALREAQAWLRDATAEEMQLASYYEKHSRRDPYAFHAMQYFMKHPSVKPFSHPFYWAAFTFTGI